MKTSASDGDLVGPLAGTDGFPPEDHFWGGLSEMESISVASAASFPSLYLDEASDEPRPVHVQELAPG